MQPSTTAQSVDLITLLEKDCDAVSRAWAERLVGNTALEQIKVKNADAFPTWLLVHDLWRLLQGLSPAIRTAPNVAEMQQLGHSSRWKIGLCDSLEAFLTGEVVVRQWACQHLEVSESELPLLFETINRAFHRLYRFHALRYCENCRASLEMRLRFCQQEVTT